MKPSSSFIYLILCLATIFVIYRYYRFPKSNHNEERDSQFHLQICRNRTQETSLHLNYIGPILTSNSSTDVIFCPGDAFGDLNNTYVTLQDCYLTMHYQDKIIWSSRRFEFSRQGLCAASLQRDGDLVLYRESFITGEMGTIWSSNTDFYPNKTELRLQDQQLQIVHTFEDGSQRLFYAEDFREYFKEVLEAPKQAAEKFLLKNHSDSNPLILRRNEYIGDLNGIHLILESNCELQLKDKNKTIWSFAEYLRNNGLCTLIVRDGNSVGISNLTGPRYYYEGMRILPSTHFTVLQSNITFKGDQLLIIQTLEDGSERTFYSETGQDNGLKLKKEPRQIAENNIVLLNEDYYDYSDDEPHDESHFYTIERLDYIGDLNGLHLILQEDCAFVLANGQEELWRLQESPNIPLMDCSIRISKYGYIMFPQVKNHQQKYGFLPVFIVDWYEGDLATKLQLSLENNMMLITLLFRNGTTSLYHAGANTNGTWFQFITRESLIVNFNDTKDQVIQEMSYIGNINGVYALLDKRGNWLLYNKSEVIWESNTTQDHGNKFDLFLKRDGNIAIRHRREYYNRTKDDKDDGIWSTQNLTRTGSSEKLRTNELLVNNDGMWLIHTFIDGTMLKYKALEGTSSFALVSDEDESELKFILN